MEVHRLLLDRHAGGVERRHDGRLSTAMRNRRWCSDGFEIGCDNGERVRVAFAVAIMLFTMFFSAMLALLNLVKEQGVRPRTP
jgi:hypothetical protein